MDIQTFRRILTTFADAPADLDASRGKLLVQIRDEMIEAKISTRQGSLFVTENDTEFVAQAWIIHALPAFQFLPLELSNMLRRNRTLSLLVECYSTNWMRLH